MTLNLGNQVALDTFVTYLASQKRIPVSSIEPPEDYVVSELRYKYSDGAILTMYLLRQVFQLQREATQRKVDFERYLLGFAAAYKEHGLTQSPIHSFSDLQEIVRRESHIELTLDNWQHVNVYDAVYGKKGQTSQIYREVLTMRDEYAAQTIIERLKQYHRVFVIMGGDHIKNQENKLRKEFNKLNGG